MNRFLSIASVPIASLVLACGDAGPTVVQEISLVEALRERGFHVETEGESTRPFLTGVSTVVRRRPGQSRSYG